MFLQPERYSQGLSIRLWEPVVIGIFFGCLLNSVDASTTALTYNFFRNLRYLKNGGEVRMKPPQRYINSELEKILLSPILTMINIASANTTPSQNPVVQSGNTQR